jgi:hypothetical protein
MAGLVPAIHAFGAKTKQGNIDARDIGERLCPGMTTIGLLR